MISIHQLAAASLAHVFMTGWSEDRERCYALSSKPWELQCASGAALVAMQMLAADHRDCIQHLDLLEYPSSCRATKVYGKGNLTLVCCSTKIATTKPKGNAMAMQVVHNGSTLQLWIQHTFVSPLDNCKQPVDHPYVAPFWFVPEASGASPANMIMKAKAVDVGAYTCFIPVLVNEKKVGKDEPLSYKVEAESKKAKTE